MSRSVLDDAFEHHVWATLRVIDACADLDESMLETAAPGTYGSIIDTLRHLVGADCSYLFVLSGGRRPSIDETEMGFPELRAAMVHNAAAWESVVARGLDAETVLVRHRDDGSESHAPAGIRLAQALHHGTDHRSQVCTALTIAGVAPPEIDVWDFAESQGRLSEVPPPS